MKGMLIAVAGFLVGGGFTFYALKELTGVNEADLKCLALNIYWEARSEPIRGQLAVAHVTMNRVRSRSYPNSVCKVVYQGNPNSMGACQFSWYCDGRGDQPTEWRAWRTARNYARRVLEGRSKDPTGGALYYHLYTITPNWSAEKQRIARIGNHIYYR